MPGTFTCSASCDVDLQRRGRVARHSSTPETSVAEMSMGELRRMYLVQEWSIGVHQANLGPERPATGQSLLAAALADGHRPRPTVWAD